MTNLVSKTFFSKPTTNEGRFDDWVKNSTQFSRSVPTYLNHTMEQMIRHDTTEPLKIDIKNFDVYQIERELENDVVAKSERHQIRQQLADYLEKQSYGSWPYYAALTEKLRIARTSGVVGLTPEGRHITAWDEKVNCVRVCPDEAREESQRLTRKYAPEIFRLCEANPNWRIYYAVYTESNVSAGSLKEGKNKQYKRFSNMHRSKWFKERVKGSFVIQEDPLSRHQDWNVHLNAIHIVDGDFSYRELRKQWGANVHVQQIEGKPEHLAKAFMEAVKYAAKHIGEKSEDGKHTVAPGMTSWTGDQFFEWFNAGKGFRRSRTYGCLYKFKGTQDKGASLEDVSWIGSINHDGTAYQVHLKRNISDVLGVDLIQADNSAIRSRNNRQVDSGRAVPLPPNIN